MYSLRCFQQDSWNAPASAADTLLHVQYAPSLSELTEEPMLEGVPWSTARLFAQFLMELQKREQTCNFPNVLLSGAAGTGKSTVALHLRTLFKNLASLARRDIDVHVLNMSEFLYRSDIREQIAPLLSYRNLNTPTGQLQTIVILEEMDQLTREAQRSLLPLLENYPHSRFVALCNYDMVLLSSVKDRFVSLHFSPYSLKTVSHRLSSIAAKNKLAWNCRGLDDALFQNQCDLWALQAQGDMRQAIQCLQNWATRVKFDSASYESTSLSLSTKHERYHALVDKFFSEEEQDVGQLWCLFRDLSRDTSFCWAYFVKALFVRGLERLPPRLYASWCDGFPTTAQASPAFGLMELWFHTQECVQARVDVEASAPPIAGHDSSTSSALRAWCTLATETIDASLVIEVFGEWLSSASGTQTRPYTQWISLTTAYANVRNASHLLPSERVLAMLLQYWQCADAQVSSARLSPAHSLWL